jgi:hypothetical protein
MFKGLRLEVNLTPSQIPILCFPSQFIPKQKRAGHERLALFFEQVSWVES